MSQWPSKKDLQKALKKLEKLPASRPLAKDASAIERIKHRICEQFVKHLNDHELSQQELADQLKIDKAIVSKITHYRYDEFTIDRLIKYLSVLDPTLTIEIKSKAA